MEQKWLLELAEKSGMGKAFAAEVGRLCQKLALLSNEEALSKLDSKWLVDMAEQSGQTRQNLYNWWKSFTTETNRSITPKQATPEDKSAFFDWLEAAKADMHVPAQHAQQQGPATTVALSATTPSSFFATVA
ncbi:hypothetical protein [Halochromatium roseum]|uniref:hypothetical protein n=1 Tax=Halochromatium roseum TaxID=391920 RepID=UPI001912283B|nr:hypothetical protein [Halochromatium roseum]